MVAPCRALAEATDARFPLHLSTGRLRDQWHGMSRTGTVARLFNHVEEPLLSLNPRDMQQRGLCNGDLVRVSSRRGELRLRVHSAEDVRPAQAWLPMHWGSAFMQGGGTNVLLPPAFDPHSKQPELKHAAVRVEKLDYAWQVMALRSGDALSRLDSVRPLLREFPYATCGLIGRDVPVLVFRAAAPAPVADEVIGRLDAALGLDDDAQVMDYHDKRRGVAKRALVLDRRLVGARLIGETTARAWLKELIASGASAAEARRWILAPIANVPTAEARRGRVICNCFDVSEAHIRAALDTGATLEQVQERLRCGTSCGSCLPELRRMAIETRCAAEPAQTVEEIV
jgi:assimilatory nitrate reductase catalytic subunit